MHLGYYILLEELATKVGYGRYGGYLDSGAGFSFAPCGKGALLVEGRNVDLLEAELFGLGYAALDLADRPDLAAEANLGRKTNLRRDI